MIISDHNFHILKCVRIAAIILIDRLTSRARNHSQDNKCRSDYVVHFCNYRMVPSYAKPHLFRACMCVILLEAVAAYLDGSGLVPFANTNCR